MAINIPFGPKPENDPILADIVAGLETFQKYSPQAAIDVYRCEEFVVKARIVDARFAKIKRFDRITAVWKFLESIPEQSLNDLKTILCLSPKEVADSFPNREFENPRPRTFAFS